jgi:hypothetical protein
MPDQPTMDAFLDAVAATPRPRILNIRDFPQGIPEDAVYIGRGGRYGERWYGPSRWRNEYKIPRDGDRAEVIAKFERGIRWVLEDDPDFLQPLIGKRLVCHCHPAPCHGAVLLQLVKERYGDDA